MSKLDKIVFKPGYSTLKKHSLRYQERMYTSYDYAREPLKTYIHVRKTSSLAKVTTKTLHCNHHGHIYTSSALYYPYNH